MALTSCHECGSAVSDRSHACTRCGAPTAPIHPAAYRPPPRPSPLEEKRPAWAAVAGWAAVLAGCALFVLLLFRWSAEIDRRAAAEKAEMTREEEHMRRVIAWAQDTSSTAPFPGSADRPAPTSDRAKRKWVISRMLEDQWMWERQILTRHGADLDGPPRSWGTGRYQANARSYPEVGKHLEGHVAALAEIEASSAAWMEERTAALARESGIPDWEVRGMFADGFAGVDQEEERLAGAMLEVHRHLVRVDPRVRYEARADRLLFDDEDEMRRAQELETKLRSAVDVWKQARDRRQTEVIGDLYREID
jgi:hypothetical protein